ncbi:N-glycosylation protein-domain-containing protein [Xylariales sp. PMI_506]|nr:N-glycosylation protein-domain-containing protein [Xylariales sp. PMI_506]
MAPPSSSDDEAAEAKHTSARPFHGETYRSITKEKRKKKPVVTISALQPRVAVVLGVPKIWHPFLFACRLFSIVPALWWGLRCSLRFLITDFLNSGAYGDGAFRLGLHPDGTGIEATEVVVKTAMATMAAQMVDTTEKRWRLTEMALSIIWCGASAYLSFLFTDSLMSRWLLNYTPQATIIRLFTLCCIFGSVSSQLIHVLGGDQSPSMLLPAWIAIATTLTACYHVSQRRINIRKETSASISVFSIASFISMVALLLNLNLASDRKLPSDVPLAALLRRAADAGGRLVVFLLGVNTTTTPGTNGGGRTL